MAENAPNTPIPAGLGAEGEALWVAITDGLTLRADEVAVLTAAARIADQITALEDATKGETMIPGSRNQMVLHPAIPELRQQRQLLSALLGRLDIPEVDGSIGGSEWDNLSSSQRARKAAHERWSA